ncbi:group III truncated hemoglobin [Paracoccus caeni]|uniref:Group III truncated hemoglobin n=1 Tax=Paracoccus caeni TaxID=657651 RepID=A0A934SF75_9RHOB|nr:group III truncated hemoglobin [Paracoccus caeni]MBK4216280.1 group III truncated hemoglobin [Paracoccus caeni]
MTLPPRFPITEDQIDRIVATFYARIRRHDILGPVFANHVTDWPEHEAKIARFWRKAILGQPAYDGNPMQVHRAAGDVKPEHFAHWLALFDDTLTKSLPEHQAASWSALAHRIGRGLRLGVEEDTRPTGAPPSLR